MNLSSKRIVATLGAVLLVCSLMAVGATGAGAAPPDQAQDEHARIVDFWTNERVAQAIPRDFVLDPANRQFRPAAKPGSGGGGTTTTTGSTAAATSTIGSSWTGGGDVLKSTGKVLFTMGGTYYVCSASAVRDSATDRSLVLTAGHCAYDETNRAFAANWMFVPDYDSAPTPLNTSGSFCATTSLGCWTARSLVVHSGFATAGSFNTQATQHDFAFAVVGPGGKANTQLDATVRAPGIAFAGVAGGSDTALFGYPAEGRYKGNDLVYCRGPLGFDPYNSNLTYRVACNMNGGSSGGPWYSPFGSGTGTLMSVNSYGYSGITAMHGPMFNAKTQAVYNGANTVTLGVNSIVL